MSNYFKIPKWTVVSLLGVIVSVVGLSVISEIFRARRLSSYSAWPKGTKF